MSFGYACPSAIRFEQNSGLEIPPSQDLGDLHFKKGNKMDKLEFFGITFLILLVLGAVFLGIKGHKEEVLCRSFLSAKYDEPAENFQVYDFDRGDKNETAIYCKYASKSQGYDFDIFFEGIDHQN